jgi:hypothetical protein
VRVRLPASLKGSTSTEISTESQPPSYTIINEEENDLGEWVRLLEIKYPPKENTSEQDLHTHKWKEIKELMEQIQQIHTHEKDVAEPNVKHDIAENARLFELRKQSKEVAEPYESDILDAFWHSVEPSLLRLKIKEVFPNHKLVEKEKLEQIIEGYRNLFGYTFRDWAWHGEDEDKIEQEINDFEEKYLSEEDPNMLNRMLSVIYVEMRLDGLNI